MNCAKRLDAALTVHHFIAYILDPRFCGDKLTEKQYDSAMDYLNAHYSNLMPEILLFRAKGGPFKKYSFSADVVQKLKPIMWWKSLNIGISPEMMKFTMQLFSAVASSASLERIFSTYGYVHSKVRNRLGNEKAAKLVTVFKELN